MNTVQPIRDVKNIEAMKKVLLSGKTNGLRNHLLFVLGINSGLRISDLLGLTVGDVYSSGKVKQFISLREEKTNKEKRFPLNQSASSAIEKYIKVNGLSGSSKPLFASRKGSKPISRVQAWEILNNAAQAVGIKDAIGTHTLRKTFGYHNYNAGVSVEKLQSIFNHSSSAITLRYIGITQDEIDDVYMGLNL